ncbi:MAG: hypothetical protein VYD27_04535 [Candidatus Thermoplasmatota archaeon]|jgi:hypothetical protein|nr:hypothetical protein [Candidatus Thermoplasmatota archaeon]
MAGEVEAFVTYSILSLMLGFYVVNRIKLLRQLTSEMNSRRFHFDDE